MSFIFQKTCFVKSVLKLSHLPHDENCEIAFAGRSNAGKSSAINAITGIKGLARTSKTPGRTQCINIFNIEPGKRLIDLPGYGYAKVPEKLKREWQPLLDEYFHTRASLKGFCLMMDIRHPLRPLDQTMIEWAQMCQLPLHILLTKSDKLSHGKALQVLHQLQKSLTDYPLVSCQLFSAVKGEGLAAVRKKIIEWFSMSAFPDPIPNLNLNLN